ncbi:DNA repair protein [Clostridium omnivorum]|uniref:DNA repair protein n=1 Tax=Clostridium omnivorum TaxID=1604902 RepID=A0ABQ5N7I2_9CLOT|nr:DNA repair protein [Clostridium sp. E14]GLC31142.1 hypothetical protein bsdE14_25520 [Clostridium sp. E14]
MGFFGGLVSKVKSCANAVVDKVKQGASYIKHKVTNVWTSFTGKKYFDEAEGLYDKITERYYLRQKQFEDDVDSYTDLIEKHVKVINKSKEKIKFGLLPEMSHKLKKIKDISVSGDFTVEAYMAEILSVDSVRSKTELYKIDFNKHKFKTTFQAIFTLGFYTRKKAKETLYAVQEEEQKINAEIAKMDAEIVKLQAIEKSLENVEVYFTFLIELYGNLLVRLDNSINFLYVRCMSFAHKLVHTEMSIRRLPVMQQKEVEAIINASKILKAMTDAQITSLENADKVNNYSKDMKQQYTELNKVYEVA